MIKCLMFDLDGTLFNTKKANANAYIKALSEEGFNVSEQEYYEVFGLRADQFLPTIAKGITDSQINKVRQKKAYYYERNINLIEPNHYLLDFLRNMSSLYKTALVTTASKKSANMVLKYFNLEKEFDVVVFGEDVLKSKPDPDCYVLAMKKCKVKPKNCLIFEDSEAGMKAALTSGANVVRVPIE